MIAKPPRSETEIVRGIVGYLRMRPDIELVWRQNVGAATLPGRFIRYGAPGQSDVLAVQRPSGRLIAVECKRPGRKPTAAQQAFLDGVNRAGGIAILATCVDDVRQALDGPPEAP